MLHLTSLPQVILFYLALWLELVSSVHQVLGGGGGFRGLVDNDGWTADDNLLMEQLCCPRVIPWDWDWGWLTVAKKPQPISISIFIVAITPRSFAGSFSDLSSAMFFSSAPDEDKYFSEIYLHVPLQEGKKEAVHPLQYTVEKWNSKLIISRKITLQKTLCTFLMR